MTRLTYTQHKLNPDLITSKHSLLTPEGYVSFDIDIKTLKYRVFGVKEAQGKVSTEGQAKTLNEAKKLVKQALKAYGVVFQDEVRVHEKEQVLVTETKGDENASN